MKKPRISIIIPCFQQGQYLSDAVDSVLRQTESAHELIIVDDGSTDNSLEVARSYHSFDDLPVKVIHQVNKGLSSARNTGIMNATGDYVLPLDADDILKENCIERITQVIEETGADIVAPSFKCFGISNEDVILMKDPTLADFKVANRITYCSAVKRDALLEIGGYSPRMIWGYEDLHLWFNLLFLEKSLVTIPEVLMLYRTKKESMITEAQKHHLELMTQIYKDFPR